MNLNTGEKKIIHQYDYFKKKNHCIENKIYVDFKQFLQINYSGNMYSIYSFVKELKKKRVLLIR